MRTDVVDVWKVTDEILKRKVKVDEVRQVRANVGSNPAQHIQGIVRPFPDVLDGIFGGRLERVYVYRRLWTGETGLELLKVK